MPAALAISTRVPIYLYIGRFAGPRAIRGVPTPKAITIDVDDFYGLEGVVTQATAVYRRVEDVLGWEGEYSGGESEDYPVRFHDDR